VAGPSNGGDGEDNRSGAQLLPVGDRREVAFVLGRVLPGLDLSRIELHPAPERAKWLRPIGWRYLAYGVDDQVLVTVRGWVSRRTSVVLHHKTQSVRLGQGPLDRRLRLATVHVDTPVGPADAIALHRDIDDAAALVAAQAGRAREARRAAAQVGRTPPARVAADPAAHHTQPNEPSPDGSVSSAASPAEDSSAT
jgi:putative membrane protein